MFHPTLCPTLYIRQLGCTTNNKQPSYRGYGVIILSGGEIYEENSSEMLQWKLSISMRYKSAIGELCQ